MSEKKERRTANLMPPEFDPGGRPGGHPAWQLAQDNPGRWVQVEGMSAKTLRALASQRNKRDPGTFSVSARKGQGVFLIWRDEEEAAS